MPCNECFKENVKRSEIPYGDTIPSRWGAFSWYVPNYPNPASWTSEPCRPMFLDATAQGHAPTNVFSDFNYGVKCPTTQTVPYTPESGSINPLSLALIGGVLSSALYK